MNTSKSVVNGTRKGYNVVWNGSCRWVTIANATDADRSMGNHHYMWRKGGRMYCEVLDESRRGSVDVVNVCRFPCVVKRKSIKISKICVMVDISSKEMW